MLSCVEYVSRCVFSGFDNELCRETGTKIEARSPCNYNSRSWHSSLLLLQYLERPGTNSPTRRRLAGVRPSRPPRKPCPPLGHFSTESAPLSIFSHSKSEYYRERKPKSSQGLVAKYVQPTRKNTCYDLVENDRGYTIARCMNPQLFELVSKLQGVPYSVGDLRSEALFTPSPWCWQADGHCTVAYEERA
jgi:hypothetical protein